LRNADHFDPQKLSRYTVFRVYYEFPGELRHEEKYFVVLRHIKRDSDPLCCCIKPTSKVARYLADPSLLRGVIFYEGKALRFFGEDTIIDPDQDKEIPIAHLIAQAKSGRYRVEGRMPEDFHDKLVKAIKQSKMLSDKRKSLLLGYINENADAADA
jgi:hypothetical protein